MQYGQHAMTSIRTNKGAHLVATVISVSLLDALVVEVNAIGILAHLLVVL